LIKNKKSFIVETTAPQPWSDMNKPFVIVVNGLPATGKSSMAKVIAQFFSVPLLSKDGYKEVLYDTMDLVLHENGLSKKLGACSFEMLYVTIEALVKAGVSCVVEAPFDPVYADGRFQAFRDQGHCTVVQVFLQTSPDVILNRFNSRTRRGQRHAVHGDEILTPQTAQQMIMAGVNRLSAANETIHVDTTEFVNVDFDHLIAQIRRAVA
jgi:predicted kinase